MGTLTKPFTKHVLVAGLGNHNYPGTRHNVGMMIVDSFARRFNVDWKLKPGWQSDFATVTTTVTLPKRRGIYPKERGPPGEEFKKGPREMIDLEITLTLLKSRMMMNVSGTSLSRAVKELGITVENVLVVHDDLERDIGKISSKSYGSAGGHNGIASCIKYLRSQHFRRLRIGIGRPPFKQRSSDIVSSYVLGKFNPSEIEILEQTVFPKACDDIIRMTTVSSDPSKQF
ncbi:peptidyl-tRNA hydrolase protein 1 [Modicella reniformis]|uniref:Peptidyl-tRNA hydrolase n=1 Tax=Modicella reniformis TaxID=1440133 RepID=A0A9P6J605_9FUNG|nr:peptidyl-tRNA hydrolase protein 1 [Modicella reniformis]